MKNSVELVKKAMLAVQRYPWEQGVCAQAIYECGDVTTAVAMAHDAVLRQAGDGRLAMAEPANVVTDPASNGEVVLRAWELTGEGFYKDAADRMLDYLLHHAPRTPEGALCHIDGNPQPGTTACQVWVDSVYMAPPFLAAMGEVEEAANQIRQYVAYLRRPDQPLLSHIYDVGNRRFIRPQLWATGNGWALLGIARVIDFAAQADKQAVQDELVELGTALLEHMLALQLPDGRFHDILNDETSFVDGTSAMMTAAFIYRGCHHGWLSPAHLPAADRTVRSMEQYVDKFGIIHGVCGCPDFVREGTSAESMAAYLMMHGWRQLYENHSGIPYFPV